MVGRYNLPTHTLRHTLNEPVRLTVAISLPYREYGWAYVDISEVDDVPAGKAMHGHLDGALGRMWDQERVRRSKGRLGDLVIDAPYVGAFSLGRQ